MTTNTTEPFCPPLLTSGALTGSQLSSQVVEGFSVSIDKSKKANPYESPEAREKRSARVSAYYRSHKKQIEEKKAQYRIVNKEKIKARQKIYSAQNRDKINAALRAWKEKNKERHKAQTANYNLAHKQEIAEKRRVRRLANIEASKAKAAAYHEKNKEKRNLRSREYHRLHREKSRAKSRQYHIDHKEKSNQQSRDWMILHRDDPAHKEKTKARSHDWYMKNRERVAQKAEARRAMLAGVDVGDLRLISSWEKRWTNKKTVKCYWCLGWFNPSKCHSDHVIPISKGGSHSVDNLCVSCSTCNLRKSAKDLTKWNNELTAPVLL